MKIEKIDINLIKPYAKNAKLHPAEQIEQIKQSILDFGNNDPIAIDENNVIIEGHGRYEALKELGFKKAEVIRLDHLDEEQRKAYMLVHNKLTMNSDFDYSLVNEEIEDIISIDMEQYGFELFDPILEKEINATETQRRVSNILNLDNAQFEGEGKYDIPIIEPVYDLEPIDEWIGFNYVLSDDDPTGKAVHFFIDDYQFERVWNNPSKYVDKLKQYVCVAAPDFSPYGDMPLATQIFNHYRKHWVACYLQQHGVKVIPCVRSSTDERSLEFFTDGTPKDGIIIISTMWTKANATQEQLDYDRRVYEKMLELNPRKIFVYGKADNLLEEMYNGEIEYIDNFTSKWNKKEVDNGE